MEKYGFNHFQFKPFIKKAIEKLSFHKPTEIQNKMIPLILKGESAIGQSQTGTGKTHAFLLPIIQKIDPKNQHVQAVIAAPTRELANQIYGEALKIVEHEQTANIHINCLIGGTDKKRSIERLKQQPHIVIGTPGRINDLVNEQALFVHQASMLVIDEADLAFDMGFVHDIDQFASRMPENLQMYVFSATIPEKMKPFLKKYMENPVYEQIEPTQLTAENIDHVLIPVRSREKVSLLKDVLLSSNPYLAIVFVNTKQKADEVADQLIQRGIKVGRMHGDLTPRERRRMMKQIRNLDYQYIVATDLAARGIDIPGVSHIINYELPRDLEFYIHRSGRTARAGNKGIAATIYEPADEDAVNHLEKLGIEFSHRDVRENQWVEIPDRQRRKKRKQMRGTTNENRPYVRKPKKVKPGYKKKMAKEIERIRKRERRLERQNKNRRR